MAETFEVDPVEMKATVLLKGAAAAKTAHQHKLLMEQALKQVDKAVAEENFAVARQLCDLGASEASRAQDGETASQALDLSNEVERFAGLYETAQNAVARLKADPVDPQANTDMGKYLGFVKMDWDKGMLMLALGNDPALKELAAKELEDRVICSTGGFGRRLVELGRETGKGPRRNMCEPEQLSGIARLCRDFPG